MTPRFTTLLFLLLFAFTAFGADEPPRTPSAPGLSQGESAPAQEYAYGEIDGEKLMLDVYPARVGATPNVSPGAGVLLVHGGGWCMGSRKDVVREARALAASGYVAFAIGYRLCNGPARHDNPALPVRNRYPAALDDCQRAVRWIRSRAAEFQVDPQRLGAIGWSAGGHLVALLGTIETRDNSDPALASYSSRVNAVVNVFGPADFLQPLPETNLRGEPLKPDSALWIESKPVRWLQDDFLGSTAETIRREASPLHHVDGRSAPFLIIHGAKDNLVPVEHSRALHAKLKENGRQSLYVEFPDEGHGFTKAENQQRFAREVLAFFRSTLGDPAAAKTANAVRPETR